MAPLIPLEFRKAETKGRKQAVLSPCAHFSISACLLPEVLYLLFFYNMESLIFAPSSLDHLRVHSRAGLSILLPNHICRCYTWHNKAHEVGSISLLMLLSWYQVTSGHSVTPLPGNICWGFRMQHRSQTVEPGHLQQLCYGGFVVSYQATAHRCVITALGGAAAGLGEAQMVFSGKSHTFEADKASQATCCSATCDVFRN